MTQLVADGLWTWFQDPRAVWGSGKLFLGFNSTTGIWIAELDSAGQTLASFRLRDTGQIDDHDVASVGIRPDGRLLVAYCEHNDAAMRVRVSTDPFSAAGWDAEITAATPLNSTITYPNLWYLSSESRWYLFYRDGIPGPPTFVTSDDGGETWSAPQHLLVDNGERPYTRMDSDGVGRIDICLTDGHPNSVADNSIYHMYYDGDWRGSDGTDLGDPPFAHADVTPVWDGSAANSWNWDIATRGDEPVILFASFPAIDDHQYNYARWSGTEWEVRKVVAAGGSIDETGSEPFYSAGIYLDHDDPEIAYVCRDVDGTFELERWATSDAGLTWSSERLTESAPPVKNFRPVTARGSGAIRVIWCRGSYSHFTGPFSVGLETLQINTAPSDGDSGLPQVATATIRNRLTWLSCNLADGAVITELPDLQGDEVSRVIGEYTSANLSLPIPAVGGRDLTLAQRAQLAIQSTQPPRTKIVAVVNDVPAWEGIPLPRDLGTDAEIPLGCVSMEGYLRHVYIGDHTFDEQDVALIADGILRDAVTTPHGPGIALTIDAPNIGTIASRSYLDIDNRTVYSGLQELMQAGLMEWTLQPDWRMGMAYRVVDTIARVRGRLGRSGDPQAVFQSATFSSQGASDARYQLREDYGDDRYANVVRLHGAGQGEDQPRSTPAIDQGALDSGVPVWELRDSAPQSVTEQALLDLHAERRLDRVRDGAHTLEITARWDAPGARLGVDWELGDLVRHELRGHAHPGGLNGVKRAIGFALSIGRGTIRPILQDEEA